MRVTLLLFAFLVSSTSLAAQQLPEWFRVYTFDESIIEMNTTLVTIRGKDIGSVRFRWTFDRPEALSGEPRVKYKRRLEVMEFNCSQQSYRLYEVTLFNEAGSVIRKEEVNPPDEWRTVGSGSVMRSLFSPACALINRTKHPPVPAVVSEDAIELEKVGRYAISFKQSLEQSRDFKPIIENFFAADYLNGYLRDKDTNWFLNLDRDTAAKAGDSKLQRFYTALLNASYLSSLYLISQTTSDDESTEDEKLIPLDILQLIKNHQYTSSYKGNLQNFDYLAENINSVERLRSYTDLLERIAALMRKHVIRVHAERSKQYLELLGDLDFEPRTRICSSECLGLPKGTKLFEINVPIFLRLQIAAINGELKIVSAMDYFH